eukprot:8440269-Pyramimonas_sp.AAC.1
MASARRSIGRRCWRTRRAPWRISNLPPSWSARPWRSRTAIALAPPHPPCACQEEEEDEDE